MEEKIENHICDVCGSPATNFSQDMILIPNQAGFMEYIPRGRVKYGCDKHLTKSNNYSIDGFLLSK